MPERFTVGLQNTPYDIVVGDDVLDLVGLETSNVIKPTRCAVVSDSVVAPLYAQRVEKSLRDSGFDPIRITVPSGEKSKSISVAETVCDKMISAGLDRTSAVVALGGGVIGDLAGFVAAIYYRGIPYIQIPTTIVSQVDSSIGGKTGVNAGGGKNLLGAFHQPRLVLADPRTLATLPPREFNEGFAEVIKHAAIRDPEMLELLGPERNLEALVARNARIKATIVQDDEFETKGIRAFLNFGHTIGHGIEAAAGYGRLLHGEAISLGIAAACVLSEKHANLSSPASQQLLRALATFNLPLRLPSDISTQSIMESLSKDKKFSAGSIRFVLLRSLGDPFISRDITTGDIELAIESIR
jgi:3-dehydroquinate synthase